jgi:transglutaminase-like putative cysteine protease
MIAGSIRMPVAAAFATITAAICLGPAFLTGSWFFPTVVGVVLVGVGCEVARRMSASRATVPLGGLVALVLYLLLRYGHDQALLGIIPWTGSIDRLGDLASAGRLDINRYAAPIGISPGIEFITVAGVGLVALAVDTLAVTFRRAALAGLPLLVLYTVPTAIAPEGVNWVAFAVAGIAFLTLLLAESRERVSRWGRPMRYSVARENYRPEVETTPLSQVGRRVGATALGLALVVPAVLPDVSAGTFGFGNGGFGSGGGGDKVEVINPILKLGENLRQGENTPVIRYSGRPTYLRLVGLDEFTGDVWQPSELEVSRDDNDVEDGLTRAPGLGPSVATTKRSYRIEVFDLAQTWLPLPYPATRVNEIDGTWLYDTSTFNVFGENSSTQNLDYRVKMLSVSPTPDQLRGALKYPRSIARYVELPRNFSPEVQRIAEQVTAGQKTGYDRALALQNWLRDRNEFTYSQTLDSSVTDGTGEQAILGFLETRRGYCVQFASTMAVMARMLDIPARVAVGFAAGSPSGDGKRVVGLNDAHAWPELFFQGVGWVAFEPTPAGPASAPPAWARVLPGASQPSDLPSSDTSETPGALPSSSGGPNRQPIVPQDQPVGGNGGIGAGPVRVPVVPFVVAVGLLLLLAVPSVTRLLVRRRRWSDADTPTAAALAAWADLQDTLVDHGFDWDRSDPPRRGAVRLAEERHIVGEPAAALHRVAAATEQARYAPDMSAVGDLRSDVDTVRGALSDGSTRWGRWRARLLPRSTRAVSVAASERLADGLDAIDAAVSTVTTRLRLRRS